MINLKSKQGRRKRTNNERWYSCSRCKEFRFAFYDEISDRRKPYCPRCGKDNQTHRIEAPTFTMRENYRSWTKDELLYLEGIVTGEIGYYQATIELDRSLSSVRNKVRRIRKKRGKEDARN